SGVDAVEVIDAVAKIEQITGAESVIHPGQIVRRVKAGGELPGLNTRSPILDGIKHAVDGRDVRRENSNEACPVLAHLFEVGKEEGAVVFEWTAKCETVLGLGQSILFRGQGIPSVQPPVAQEPVQAPVPIVGAGTGDHIDDSPRGAAEFRDASGCNDLEFADYLLAEIT